MADYTVEIELPDHKRGDWWVGIAVIGPVLINGAQPANALERIRMQFRDAGGNTFTLDSDEDESPDAPIVIDDAATWEAHIPEVQEFIQTADTWDWDMEFYQATKESPLTIYKGKLVVHEDVAKDVE